MRPGKFAPFIHTSITTPYINVKYLIALIPCVVYAIVSYGIRALVLIAFSAFLSTFFDVVVEAIKNQSIKTNKYFDYASISGGIVFALLLPPDCSLIVAAVGILAGSLVFKQLFGGAGTNIFVIPVAGRLLIEALFPSQLDTFATPGSAFFEYRSLLFDSNTHESIFQVGHDFKEYSFVELLAGRYPSFIGTGCVILIIVSLVYLIMSKTTRITTTASYLFFVFVASLVVFWDEGILYVCSFMLISGVFFVAVFLLSDYTTTSNSFYGSVISGIVSAVVFVLCFKYSSSIVAICGSVLVCNLMSFIMDYYKLGHVTLVEEVEE